jgi:hypothetical protein
MTKILIRAAGIWLLMLMAAVLNAALREQLFAPWLAARVRGQL